MIDKLTKIFCISRDICWDMDSISLLASLICVSLILGCSGKQWIFPNCGYTCELLNYARNCNGLFVSSPAPLSLRLSPAVTVTLGFRQRLRLKLNNKKKSFICFYLKTQKWNPIQLYYISLSFSLWRMQWISVFILWYRLHAAPMHHDGAACSGWWSSWTMQA